MLCSIQRHTSFRLKVAAILAAQSLLLLSTTAYPQEVEPGDSELIALDFIKNSVLSPSLLQLMPNSEFNLPNNNRASSSLIEDVSATLDAMPEMSLQIDDELIMLRIVISKEADSNRVSRALRRIGMQSLQQNGVLITGRLPVASVSSLQSMAGIVDVRPSYAGSRSGVTATQGDEASNADFARTASSLSGNGITVGILSDSYDCDGQAMSDMSNGDLPQNVLVLDDGFCGTDEGRAMMQIVHDMAPGANLAFHTAFLGELDYAAGINELVQAGADVIMDDVFYYEEPFFQDGFIAQAARDASQISGVPYFTAAGNHARYSWEGGYQPSNQSIISSGDAHEFASGDVTQSIGVSPFGVVVIVLQWDDPYSSLDSASPGPDTDLDIALYDNAGNQVALSADSNIGSDPYEAIVYFNGSQAQQLNIVIEKQAGPDPSLMKWVGFAGVTSVNEYDTASGTIVGRSNAESVLSIGAVNYSDTPRFGASTPALASYSSGGPAPILFLADGTSVGPVTRDNPDLTAPDDGNNTVIGFDTDGDGFPNFRGTSAAVVHAASIAALLLEHSPSMTPVDIENTLESTAIDHGVAGYDTDTGHGLVDAVSAVASVLNPPTILSPSTGSSTNGDSVDISWIGNEFDVDSWQVLAGTSAPTAGTASSDLFSSAQLDSSVQTIEITGLPEDDSAVFVTLEWTFGNTTEFITVELTSGRTITPSFVTPSPGDTTPLMGSNIEVTWSAGSLTVDDWRLRIGTTGFLSSDVFDSLTLAGSETGTTATGLALSGELLYFTLDYSTGGVVQTIQETFVANNSADFVTVPPAQWHLLSIPAASSLTFSDFVAGHLDPADFMNPNSATPWIAFRYNSEIIDPQTNLLGGYEPVDLSESLDGLYQGFWLLHLNPQEVNLDLPADATHAAGVATSECSPGFYCENAVLANGNGSGGWSIGSIPSNLEPSVGDLRIDTSGTGTICDSGCTLAEADQQGLASSTVWIYDPAPATGAPDYVQLGSIDAIPRWSGFWVSTSQAGFEILLPVR